MKYVTVIVCLLLFGFIGRAQNMSITGTVKDRCSKRLIAGANIFISNTAKGTVSDANGAFALHDIAAGKFELVISITGYETIVYPFNSSKLPLKLDVQMEVKVKQWETVNVTPFEKNGWEKWGKLFTDAFLGQSPNAADCKILYKDAIRFRHNKKEGFFEAVADTLLIIENKALGYMLRYQLEAFQYSFTNRSVVYGGYPLFEEMDTTRKAKQRRYDKARRRSYYGSTMHFMRSLFSNRLAAEGFDVRRSQKIPNEEKQRVKKLYGVRSVNNIGGNMQVTVGGNNNVAGDSLAYYQKILGQPDFYELIGRELLNADSLLTPGMMDDYQLLSFTNQLLVIYKNEKPAIEYRRTAFSAPDPYETTRMFFMPDAGGQLHVYANGSYFDPMTLFLDGYMGWEKIAELLPLEYKPEE